MKIKVTVEVEVPEGATHYAGEILDDPTYWKSLQRSDGEHWYIWEAERRAWCPTGTTKPYWICAIAGVKYERAERTGVV